MEPQPPTAKNEPVTSTVVAGTNKKVGIVADCGDRTHALTNTRLKRAP